MRGWDSDDDDVGDNDDEKENAMASIFRDEKDTTMIIIHVKTLPTVTVPNGPIIYSRLSPS
jgi:hypothetical protein